MTSEFDRDNLISIFVLEASDAMTLLMKALSPPDGRIPNPQQLVGQYIVAHRVRGAAALYGYAGVARLAERLEILLEQATNTSPAAWPGRVVSMRDLTHHIQLIVGTIGQGGREDVDLIERCLATAHSVPAEEGDVGGAASATSLTTPEYVLPSIDSEILSYFVPEVEEYLTVIAQLIGQIRRTVEDDLIYKLFRAIHTLKGSAYTVGYQVIGDIALPMEDCMIAVREQGLPFNSEVVDTMEQGATLIRLVLRREPTIVRQLQRDVPLFIERVTVLSTGGGSGASVSDMTSPSSASPVPVHATEGFDADAASARDTPSDQYVIPILEADVMAYFAPEAQEYLDSLETSLLQLEGNPDDTELIHQLFRTAHTLKGSAYTVGYQSIGDLVHHVEDFMGAVREGRLRVLPGMTDVILRSIDVVRLLLRRDWSQVVETRKRFEAVRLELGGLGRGTDSAAVQLHTVSPPHMVEDVPAGEGVQQKQEIGDERKSEGNREVIRVSSYRLERLMNLVGELVIGRGRLEQRLHLLEQLSKQVLVCKTRLGESVQSFSDKHTFTYQETPAGPAESVRQGFVGLSDFGALELDKYDDFNILARRVGEISADISESMSQLHSSIHQAYDEMTQLQQLTLAMRDEIARARMVPIGTPFTRFRRAIREIARASKKDVSLVTSGEQTEVDTNIVERLVDPLVHLVRNAVYHGIERPADRVLKGKPAVGTVSLHAAHRGNSVVIEIEDDGAGLDLEKIRVKAAKVGLIQPDHARSLSVPETLQLIFAPGFSTADEIDDQAGRGVGLDVVKRVIESINGHIDVESTPGVGTKFTLHLPLTLLIATALLVRAGTERYAIPLQNIREVTLPTESSLKDDGHRTLLRLGDERIELQSLYHVLRREPGHVHWSMPIVVVRTATGVMGLAVDELLGRQEIVIKSLGTLNLMTRSVFGGATIDPEGRVILVLDPSRFAARERQASIVRAQVSLSRASSGAPHGTMTHSSDRQGSQILLVDDSLSIRKFVGKMLESAGYQIDTAVDGEDGLRKATTGAYRLIITDLELPKLNGFEVVQALRSHPQTHQTPVIVMTTRAGDKHRQIATTIGASAYIAKPVEERTLLHEVERWVGPASVVHE